MVLIVYKMVYSCQVVARLSLLIEDRIEDGEWLSELARITARELPDLAPKKKR